MLPFSEVILGWFDKLRGNFGIRTHPWIIFFVGLSLLLMASLFMPSIAWFAFQFVLFLAPLWLPLVLVNGAFRARQILSQSEFIASQKYVLLEIVPPRSISKTPLAMEAFLGALHQTGGESTWYARWQGKMRPWFSLEMASFEGQVHFFIWTRANFRRLIESQLYAQYPGVQIVDAPDYSRFISGKPGEWDVWGCDYKHTDADPLPIKTYVEYGLDKTQKEPEQVDPLANLIEFLASAGKGEYVWMQFIVRAHKGEKYKKGPKYSWKDEAKTMVDKIRDETRSEYVDPATGKKMPGFPNPTKGQMEKIAAIERNVSKLGFDVGGRGVYLAKPESFNPIMITGLISAFKAFHSEGWNGIRGAGWLMRFDDYPWEFRPDKLKNRYRTALVEAYRRRQFFFDPFGWGISPEEGMVMSTEELATIYHIPSRAVETPSLGRIQSATAEAPVNLPT